MGKWCGGLTKKRGRSEKAKRWGEGGAQEVRKELRNVGEAEGEKVCGGITKKRGAECVVSESAKC